MILLLVLLLSGTAFAQTPVERGRYLAAAGDCIACHTATGGRPFVGGRPIPTPFGTIYSTNITPDRKTGIGNFTLEDFDAAMRRGRGPHGNLYPAMPYTSYYLIDGDDIEALYSYFMQLPPVEYSPPKNELTFPTNLRFGLRLWNRLYFDDEKSLPRQAGKSEQWRRGSYLVNALGHCGECHTPRNFAQAMDTDRRFAGNLREGWDAVDIRPRALRRQGWTREQLMALFTTAGSERGTPFGEMFRVVKHSLRHLSEEDLNAIITYLLDDSGSRPPDFHNPEQAAARYPAGRRDFIAYCAGCHGREGRGTPLAFAPPLGGNAAIRAQNPHNAIAVILRGLPQQRLSRTNARAGMPGFHRELDDGRIAELVNFMRGAWGGAEAEVNVEEVKKIRRDLSDGGYLK